MKNKNKMPKFFVDNELYTIDDFSPEMQITLSKNAYEVHDRLPTYEPKKIGHYSITINKRDNSRIVNWDETNISKRNSNNNIKFPLDLSENFDDNIDWKSNSSISKIDEILKWILFNKDKLETQKSKLKFDFVSYRGSISKILITPYVKEDWIIGASIHNGTIYFCKFELEDQNDYPNSNLLSYAGHNFENMITYFMNNISDNDSNYVHQYAGLIDAKLKTPAESLRILLSAELDCLDYNKNDSSTLKNFIEIKTANKRYENWNNLYKYKAAKWWAQSYLAGIPKVVCGFKTKNQYVEKIKDFYVENFTIQDTPNKRQRKRHKADSEFNWDHHICLNFLVKFLVYVKFILSKETDPSAVYLFDNYTIPSSINCWKLLSTKNIRFLPQWYIDKLDE